MTVSSKACRMKMHFSKCSQTQTAKTSRIVAVLPEESAESGSELDYHENETGDEIILKMIMKFKMKFKKHHQQNC